MSLNPPPEPSVSFDTQRIVDLAARIKDHPECGQTWLRELAMKSLDVAVCHQQLADAQDRAAAKAAAQALGEAVRELHQGALRLSLYHESLDTLLRKPVIG